MPALGVGTWQLTGDTCRRTVETALEAGYRHIDTAQMYGNEAEVGRAVEDSGLPRGDLWITTKLWFDRLEPGDVRAGVEESCDKLRTEYLDLMLIHWPNPDIPLEDTLSALAGLREGGRIRELGVSNFPPGLMRRATELAPVFCNQVEYHPYLSQAAILEQARRAEQMVTAYCPLAKGRVPGDRTLADIGRRHGKSAAQVALRWLLDQPNVAAIPRSSKPDHVRSNFEVFDFELGEDERRRIDGLESGERLIDPDFGPDWDA